jgi:UDP-2,3-diacylglucosamine hydrolase
MIAGFSARFTRNLGDSQEPLVLPIQDFAMGKFRSCDAVVVGHCHLPVHRETTLLGRPRHFVALGDWIRHFSYLEYGNGKFDLLSWRGK